MDFFDKDKLKKGLNTLQQRAQVAAEKAVAGAHMAAEKAAAGAQKLGNAAQAELARAGSKGHGANQFYSVNGVVFYAETLLAEGGFGMVYNVTLATPASIISRNPQMPVDQQQAYMKSQVENSIPGVVFNQAYVLKRMFAGTRELAAQLSNEVAVMNRLKHPNIVRVLASDSRRANSGNGEGTGIEILVLMEKCPGGHLLDRLNGLRESGRVLPYTKILDVFLQIVSSIEYMHTLSPPVTHRDLKFENILVAQDGSLRLCDFGSVDTHEGPIKDSNDRMNQEDLILRFTTPHFRAPEMCDLFSGAPLDMRTDIWALGCMLFGLAYYSHPFQDAGNLGILSSRFRLPLSPSFPAPIFTMIRACLRHNPLERPTATQLKSYIEAVQAVAAANVVAIPLELNSAHRSPAVTAQFPPLSLSGGGSMLNVLPQAESPTDHSLSVDGNAPISGVSVGGLGRSGDASGDSASGSTGATATRLKQVYVQPTAADILNQLGAGTSNSGTSSGVSGSAALQRRLGNKGAAAGGHTTVGTLKMPSVQPTSTHSVPSVPVPAPAPAPAAAPVSSVAADDFGSFSFDSFGSSTTVSSSAIDSGSRCRAVSGDAGNGPTSSSSGFDFFDSAPNFAAVESGKGAAASTSFDSSWDAFGSSAPSPPGIEYRGGPSTEINVTKNNNSIDDMFSQFNISTPNNSAPSKKSSNPLDDLFVM